MKLYLDSADLDEIKEMKSYGMISGVTTNPSLIKKAIKKHGIKNIEDYIKRILEGCEGLPVSLEVSAVNHNSIVNEGTKLFEKFHKYGDVYVKIPINTFNGRKYKNYFDGIWAIKELSPEIPVNCTLIFTPEQAFLAAKAGAKIASLFAGRVDDYIRDEHKIKYKKEDYFPKDGIIKKGKKLEDNGIVSGIDLVQKTCNAFHKQGVFYECQVLAASIRNPRQLREVFETQANATVPYQVIKDSLHHPKTKEGMITFINDTVPEYNNLLKD